MPGSNVIPLFPRRVRPLVREYASAPDAVRMTFVGAEGPVEVWLSVADAECHVQHVLEEIADARARAELDREEAGKVKRLGRPRQGRR